MKKIQVLLFSCVISGVMCAMDPQASPYNLEKVVSWKAHTKSVSALAFVQGGEASRIVSGSEKGAVCLWDVLQHEDPASLELIQTYQHEEEAGVRCLAAGSTYLVSGEKGAIKVFDINRGEDPVQQFEESNWLYDIVLDEENICVVQSREGLYAYDLRSGEKKVLTDKLTPASLMPGRKALDCKNGNILYMNFEGVALYDLAAGKKRWQTEKSDVMTVCFGFEGNSAAYSRVYAGVSLVDAATGEKLQAVRNDGSVCHGSAEKIRHMAWLSPDTFLCINDSGYTYEWNTHDNRFNSLHDYCAGVVYADDPVNKLIAAGDKYGDLEIYAIKTDASNGDD